MEWLLDYLAWNPDAAIHLLNIHSDIYYLSAKGSKSRASGHFFLGSTPLDNRPIQLNGAIFILSTILKFVAALAVETELVALFMNFKEGRIIRLTMEIGLGARVTVK